MELDGGTVSVRKSNDVHLDLTHHRKLGNEVDDKGCDVDGE